jgi:hypothetical protein
LLDRFDQRIGAASAPADSLPRGEEPDERRGIDGFDLVAQRGQRTSPQRAQDAGIAPLSLDTSRSELAVHDATGGFETHHRLPGALDGDPEAPGDIVDDERNVRARVTGDEIIERVRHRIRERAGQTRGQRGAERVAQARRVFDRGQACSGADHATLRHQRIDPRVRVGGAARAYLVVVERTEVGEEIV